MKKIFLAALLTSSVQFANAQNVGVQLYSFRNEFKKDVKGTVEMIAKMGITIVEGGDDYGMGDAAFKELLNSHNIIVASIGADFNKLEKDAQSIADKAKFYGAKYVMCAWVPHDDKKGFTIDDANKAIKVFNTAGKILKDNGLTFCYHAHGYEFVPYENSNLYDYMMQQLNAEYVSFEMDVFWMKQPGQDPVALLQKYAGRYKLMHLKDRRIGTPNSNNGHADVETNVVLGTGDVGIAAIMKAAKTAGIEYFFIEDESSRSVEQVPQSLAYLKSLK
ncbi:MAG TPA: sugar phosphate isomerase/epimerase [Chitinophagaceae bacterium]|nr:sugar phosphate isomerase/epimerase [Chitinophagaceae bacterium]